MNYSKEILVKDYFDIHNFYSQIYGNGRTIILMQVGAFHECYSTEDDGIDLVNLALNLDIVCTKKDNKKPVSKSNPRMVGFPIGIIENFIDKLCNLNFTIVLINQTSDPPKPKREVIGIYSPATFINNNINKSNSILSVVIDKVNTKLCIGLSTYDILTGYGSYYEIYSNDNDIIFTLDDSIRYLETINAKEILIHTNLKDETIQNMTCKDIINYLGFNDKDTFYINYKNTNKIGYQESLFGKIFINQKNIFDITNLYKYNWARLSLTNLFEYIKNHQENLIISLKLPKQFVNEKFLYLGNHALEQLDVLPTNSHNKSLFDIINCTKTLIGKRFLKNELCKPLVDINELNNRFNLIEKLLKNNICFELQILLEDISDIERLIRRLEINILHPYELNLLYLSFYQIKKILLFNNSKKIFEIQKSTNEIDNFLDYITKTFDLNKIAELNFSNFNEFEDNIFKNNEEVLNLYEQIQISKSFMIKLQEKLSELVEDKKNKDQTLINLKFNDRDGHHFLITNRRCDNLKNKLKEIKEIKIEGFIFNINELIFTPQPKSSYTKISCKKIKEFSSSVVEYKILLAKLTKKHFEIELKNIINNFSDILLYFCKKIAFIDFINAGAVSSIKNHYIKPIIKENDVSYFKSIELRHPIVENINNDYEYKPHDISLGGSNNLCGILLYGINSSGKSTLMKSIGLNIILAQIGYYTASKSFEFSPYKSLFTRISGNDNIYRGLSSFMVEMIELTSILKRNNKNTLVIGDEICRGTEEKSANIIVAYMLKTLSENNSSFITATHLHKLCNLEIVKTLKNVQAKHLKITYDKTNDKLIFDRQLSNGQGETFYGLTVAKYLMKDSNFNFLTSEILKDYENYDVKKSKYNSNNFLVECEICKNTENLETHHINFQKDFDNNNINKDILHIQKDAKYNLVTLCSKCHDDIDREHIIINGWEESSDGRKLKFEINNKIIKKKKYSDDFINFIKLIKNQTTDPKFARIIIKEKLNIKISTKSIENIW